MLNIVHPFFKLSAANAELITHFAQSPEMAELANSSAQQYFALAQKTFGRAADSEAHADLIRRLTENYSTFAQEYSQSLIGITEEGAQHVRTATERVSGGFTAAGPTKPARVR
jgi:uncharacterized membrane-anchored protein YhcB (DUF1043 family)